jgi:hypothetical protein
MKTKKKVLTWKDVYKLPINKDTIGSYAWSSNDVMSLTFNNVSPNNVLPYDRSRIIQAINGELPNRIKGLTHNGPTFLMNNVEIFNVRGWGHLTGTGALNLPRDEAEEIQDGFINHIFESLK